MAAKQEKHGVMGNNGKCKDLGTVTETDAATEIVVLDSDGKGGAGETGVASSWSGRGSRPPPPFLQKIYEMLENDEVNSVVSWDPTGTSFVIRDHHLFSADVLPLYFKHCNFQSFISQLNLYGFKKTSWEQWEYTNKYFRKGEKHLLRNIKRRNQVSHRMQKASEVEPSRAISPSCNTEKRIENLMEEHRLLKMEIVKLKEKQQVLEQKIASAVSNENQRGMILTAHEMLRMQRDFSSNGIQQNVDGKRKLEEKSDTTRPCKRKMCSDPGSNDVISVEKICGEKGKRVLGEEEKGKHESSKFISLEELIEKSSDWIEFIREMKEKACHLKYS
ncbi:hypothetical protein BUALT_Bualt03G0064700 [Buddleja alternifolia]|uniref:HSF-type DNA-binding domain-containing protein n=1 Tax=Buddleja alternifolia TaxID=168488 RepID=A0AAV6XZQ5_9LAMI|nr:hypothetical protein BUALT_Bualt03G0064700 [Buddleja alternifolia]